MSSYLGIDVGGTCVKWGLMDDEYKIIERGKIPTDFTSAEETVEALVGLVRPHLGRISAVGVSAPGGVYAGDPDGTIHRGGALTYMDGCPLGKRLREAVGVPVAVNNDGKCCALGEYAAGALRGTSTGVVLAIGTGIGGGVVVNGRVLQGAHGFAGEFSFIRNNAQAPVTMQNIFGGSGSWLTLVALILAEKGMENDGTIDGRKAFEWIASGDEAAQRGLERYALMLDNMIVNLQAVLDPDVFAIAGGISCHPELIDAINGQMENALAGYAGPLAGFPVPNVCAAELGNDANLYGAVKEAKHLA